MSRADFSLHHVWQIIMQALLTKFIRTWTSISIAFVSCMPACELSLMMKPSIPVPDNWDNSKPAFSSLVTNYDRNRPFTLSIKIGSDRSFEQCRTTIEKAGWRLGLRQISHCWMKLKRKDLEIMMDQIETGYWLRMGITSNELQVPEIFQDLLWR